MIRHGKQLWPFASRGRAGCSFDSSNVSRVLTHRSRRRQLPGGSKSFRFLSSVNASAAIASRKGESAMDLTHRLLDLQSTPLGSYTSATTIETLDAFRYFASKTPVRLRSATLAHRLLGRYAVEISANNIWAKDESHQLAGMYDDLRKVWLDIDGRIGVEHAEASLRGAVEEYFNGRSEMEPSVASFVSVIQMWLKVDDDAHIGGKREAVAERAAGVLLYLTECLEISKDDIYRQKIENLFHIIRKKLPLAHSTSKYSGLLDQRMEQLRGEGWEMIKDTDSNSTYNTDPANIEMKDAPARERIVDLPRTTASYFKVSKNLDVLYDDGGELSSEARMNRSREVFACLREHYNMSPQAEPNLAYFGVLIDILKKKKKESIAAPLALDVFDEISRHPKLKPNAFVYRHMLHVCAMNRIEDEADRNRAVELGVHVLQLLETSNALVPADKRAYKNLLQIFTKQMPGKDNSKRRYELIALAFKNEGREGLLSRKRVKAYLRAVPNESILGLGHVK